MTSENVVLMKLEFEGDVRLVEVGVPATLAGVRQLFLERHGPAAQLGSLYYCLPHDSDKIRLVEDADVGLAVGLRSWADAPLKIVSEADALMMNPPEDDDGDVYEQASRNLLGYGMEVAPAQLEALVAALGMGPRRLVKAKLAHPRALVKHRGKKDAEEASSWEKVDGLKISAAAEDDDDDDDEVLVLSDAPLPEAVPMLGGTPVAEPGPPSEDAVVAALRSRGVTLEAPKIHALLRLLHVQPKKFVKVGLIADVKVAREAYKRGGADAARALFKAGAAGKGRKGPALKGWGRGLAGGRGRWGPGRGKGGCHKGGKGGGGHHGKGRWACSGASKHPPHQAWHTHHTAVVNVPYTPAPPQNEAADY